MHAAKDAGGNPFEHAVKVQQRLFTSKPIFLGVESAMENPKAPCGFAADAEQARYVKRKVRKSSIANQSGRTTLKYRRYPWKRLWRLSTVTRLGSWCLDGRSKNLPNHTPDGLWITAGLS